MLHPPEELCIGAMELARQAAQRGEIPVGSIVCDPDWHVLGQSNNQILQRKDPSAHAELLAIQAASQAVQSERLTDHILITTLEPCIMCTGLILHARISRVYFFTRSGWPGLLSVLDRLGSQINHHVSWRLLETYEGEASELLLEFFQSRRESDAPGSSSFSLD